MNWAYVKYYVPIQRPIVSNSRYHDDLIGSEFPNFIYERMVHEIWSSDTQIQNVYFLQNGVVKSIKKPRCVGHLEKVFFFFFPLVEFWFIVNEVCRHYLEVYTNSHYHNLSR